MLCKPIAIGCAILELAKLIMYQYYYETLVVKYGSKIQLLYTDTDINGVPSIKKYKTRLKKN